MQAATSCFTPWLIQIKERGLALRKSIDDFIEMLRFQPHLLTWAASLDRFGIMSSRHQQLVEQLSPLLKFYVIRPKSVNQANAEIVPLLLSTMKLPEMDAEEQHLLREHEATAAVKSSTAFYEELGTQIDAFNQVLKQITSHNPQQEGSGILDPKGPRLRQISQELRKAVNDAEIPLQRQAENGVGPMALLAAALHGEGLT